MAHTRPSRRVSSLPTMKREMRVHLRGLTCAITLLRRRRDHGHRRRARLLPAGQLYSSSDAQRGDPPHTSAPANTQRAQLRGAMTESADQRRRGLGRCALWRRGRDGFPAPGGGKGLHEVQVGMAAASAQGRRWGCGLPEASEVPDDAMPMVTCRAPPIPSGANEEASMQKANSDAARRSMP